MAANTIAVVETRLPYTDRRSLSEAWFSALHLAREDSPRASTVRVRAATARARVRAQGERGAGAPVTPRGPAAQPDRTVRPRAAAAAFERSSLREHVASARAAERCARARSYRPFRTSLTLAAANGARIHLIVRRVGATLHVVALCRPDVEPLVRRALARADLAFRARGERVAATVAEASR